jgi:D-glycero-D-manno-heptose 1,7-bisphosphate phosphatase
MKAVIMAGGRGTRIESVASDIPKPLIKIGDKPIIEHVIDTLKNNGFVDIIITVSYMADKIISAIGDGSKYGVSIDYYIEDRPLGNAGALFELKEQLTDDFLLVNGDVMFDVDLERMARFHIFKGGLATILVHPNSHPYDSGLLEIDGDNYVICWRTKEDHRKEYYKNIVNAGIHILSKSVLSVRPETEKVDLDRQILKPLIIERKLVAYKSTEYVKDMGTPERYEQVCSEYKEGLVSRRNISNKQKAIFLDRDGTINKYVGFLSDIDKFELLPRVSEAIRKINESEYLAIVVSNQPVIARGELTVEGLEEIHNKMETLLGLDGAYVDDIFYCPHHPDKGFEGEVPELKIDCDCRKPKPGMLLKAAEKYNIDLSQSWMIGDSERDVMAGKAAGCRSVYIMTKKEMSYGEAEVANDLFESINDIMLREE